MLVAAAVCPCPPLLVPAVASGAAGELDDARGACAAAVAGLAAARPDRLVVVGPTGADTGGEYPPGATGSFRGYGVDLAVALGRPRDGVAAGGHAGDRALPSSLAVGAWLVGHAGWDAAPVAGYGVPETLQPAQCVAAGRALAATHPRVALLVMGDGSACRTRKAPGYYDGRAAAFDAAVARALGDADATALAQLDAQLATQLRAAGRSSWQFLAGAAEGTRLTGRLRYEAAPYGVGYCVASWG